MKEIPLKDGGAALVDDEDYERLKKYRWRLCHGFVARKDTRWKFLGREILNPPPGIYVHFINDNVLDHRRQNLQLRTPAQRSASIARNRLSTCGYKGVSWRKSRRRWIAYITRERRIYIGQFKDPHDAAAAYNAKALELFGKFARLNVIDRMRSVLPPAN